MREPWVEVVWCLLAALLPSPGGVETSGARSGVDRAKRELGGVISPLGHRLH